MSASTRDDGAAPRSVVVAVGNELLSGRSVDTNTTFLGRALAGLGAPVGRGLTVPDEPEAIRGAVSDALGQADVVVVTGGLGPTEDDRTREAVAGLLGRPLRTDEAYLHGLQERFRAAGLGELPATNRSQADVPEGATVLPNPHGTAPGLLMETDEGRLVALLPGIPREMEAIVRESLLAELRARLGARLTPVLHRTLRTTGLAESELAQRAEHVLPEDRGGVEVAFLPHTTGVDVRLTARVGGPETGGEEAALARLERIEGALRPVVEGHRYTTGEEDLVEIVGDLLRRSGRTLSVAESCTGGMLGSRLTRYAGASDFFVGGVIAYDDRPKRELLGVPEELILAEGAVSEAVAREMALGAADRLGSDCAVSITGIAGPGGGSEEKPVGTVCFAAVVDGEASVERRVFPGRREDVRERSAQAALELLRRRLQGS